MNIKFKAVYKRGNVEKNVFIECTGTDKFLVVDEAGKEKLVKRETIKRWYEIGAPIENGVEKKAAYKFDSKKQKPAAKKAAKQHSRSEVKKDGTVRQDKFKPKLTAEKAYEILAAYHEQGVIKAQLARDFEVSYRTVTCIIEGLMWKDVFAAYHNKKSA